MNFAQTIYKKASFVYPIMAVLYSSWCYQNKELSGNYVTYLCMISFVYNLMLAILSVTMPKQVNELLTSMLPVRSSLFGFVSFGLFQARDFITIVPDWMLQIYTVFEVYLVPLTFFSIEIILVVEFTVGVSRFLINKIDFDRELWT